jgi:predicted nucleic acid-binding protein
VAPTKRANWSLTAKREPAWAALLIARAARSGAGVQAIRVPSATMRRVVARAVLVRVGWASRAKRTLLNRAISFAQSEETSEVIYDNKSKSGLAIPCNGLRRRD